jgi:hypothetical protein
MENKKIVRKRFNFYKFTTFILLFAILIFSAYKSFDYYSNNKFEQGREYGQAQAADYIVKSLEEVGYVTITIGNQTINLVPAESIQLAREQTILEIMNYIKKEGFVSLYDNETEVILVPYQEP